MAFAVSVTFASTNYRSIEPIDSQQARTISNKLARATLRNATVDKSAVQQPTRY